MQGPRFVLEPLCAILLTGSIICAPQITNASANAAAPSNGHTLIHFVDRTDVRLLLSKTIRWGHA